MFTVTFFSLTHQTHESRVFGSKRAARKWADFLSSQTWASLVAVWQGQPGGMRV